MISWTPDENLSMFLDVLDDLQSLVESTQSVGMHKERVFIFLRVHEPIDYWCIGSDENGNLLLTSDSGKSKG